MALVIKLHLAKNICYSLGSYEHNSSFSINIISPDLRVVDLVTRDSISSLAKVMVDVSYTKYCVMFDMFNTFHR